MMRGLEWWAYRVADVIAAVVTRLDGQVAEQRDSYRMLARHQRPPVIPTRPPVRATLREEFAAVTAQVGRPRDVAPGARYEVLGGRTIDAGAA